MSLGPQTPPAHPARGPGLPAGCKGLAFLHRGLCHTPGTVRALAHSMFTPTLCCGDRHCPHFRARVTEAERSGTCSKSHWSTTELRFEPGTAADSLSRHALPGTAAPRPAHRPPPRSWSPTAWTGLDPHVHPERGRRLSRFRLGGQRPFCTERSSEGSAELRATRAGGEHGQGAPGSCFRPPPRQPGLASGHRQSATSLTLPGARRCQSRWVSARAPRPHATGLQ